MSLNSLYVHSLIWKLKFQKSIIMFFFLQNLYILLIKLAVKSRLEMSSIFVKNLSTYENDLSKLKIINFSLYFSFLQKETKSVNS